MKTRKIIAQVGIKLGIGCFILVVGATLPSIAQKQMRDQAAQVVVKSVTQQIMNDKLTAIGTAQAQATIALTPWSSGKLEKFHVKAGDYVQGGDIVAELDKDNERIMVERARIELDDANETLDRLTRLRDSDTASRVQVINAQLAHSRAQLALKDAELALERRTLRAPIAGSVGILPIDAGNYVTASTTIARIDNRDKILIDVWLPERFTPQIALGQEVTAYAVVRRDEYFRGAISAIDNALDEASRTLRVRAELINEAEKLRAGMSFAVNFSFAGEIFSSVDPLAIQWSGEGAYVWRIDEEEKAWRVPVTIIQRNSDNVLVGGQLNPGDRVVIQGIHNVRQGEEVTIKPLPAKEGLSHSTDAVSAIR